MEKKMVKKLVALLIIVTILATDFFALGSNLITYAVQINSETNNSNIEFSAYFKNGSTRVDSTENSIKVEDLRLYAEIKVKNEGYFNGVIEILNSNFNIKNEILSSAIASIEGNRVTLKQINAGNVVEVELGIEPIISEKISKDLLSKTSTVKLTGTYMETTYEGLDIEAEKLVSVDYKIDESAKAELQTDIITNKVLSLNGTNKRIVQLLVKSRLSENQYPIKQTEFDINVPQLGENSPESVEVMAIGKLATNGLTEISSENWSYEDGKLQIIITNNADTNNEITWNKNINDELVVTFIYDETVDASEVEIRTDSKIMVYNSEKTYSTYEIKTVINHEPNSVIMGKSKITTAELYKGQLYANINATQKQDIQYNTVDTLIVTNKDVAEKIIVNEGPDTFGTETNELSANTKYISTEINKEKMLNILGEDGNITIQNGEKSIVINKDTEVDSNGNIVIEYTNSSTEITITTNKPVKEGTLEIKHTKAITGNDYTREQLKTVKNLKVKNTIEGNATVNEEKQKVVENSTEASIELKETISKAKLSVSKERLSTVEPNNVTVGVELITSSEKYDLYKNPTITIKFPDTVENVELNEAPNKLNANEFTVSSSGYDTKNKTVKITLTGEQTVYPQSQATQLYLQLNLKVTLSKLATTQTDKITMTYTNQNASLYDGDTTDYGVVENPIEISAPTGLIKMFNISSNSNTSLTEELIQKVEENNFGKIISFENILVNNIGNDINNVRVLGKLPTTGNTITGNTITGKENENTFKTTLANIQAPNAEIYYTEKADATADISNTANGWTQNLAELTNAKLYLIKLNKLSNAEEYTATVNVQIPSTITTNETSYTEYKVIYDTDAQRDIEETSRKIGLTTSIVAGLETELKAEVGQSLLNNGDTVKAGEVIKYSVIVKNEGKSALENIEINAPVPEGTVLVQQKENYVYESGYYDEKEDKNVTETINLNAGTSHTLQYEVRVKTDITTGDEVSNKATIKYNGSEMETNELKNTLKEANIRLTFKRADDDRIVMVAGSHANYILSIENLSDKNIKDLKVKINANGVDIQAIECKDKYNKIYLYGEKLTEVNINEIQSNGTCYIELSGNTNKKIEELAISVTAVDSDGETYRSNLHRQTFPNVDATIKLSSPQNNSYVKDGDKIEYNITAKNTGNVKQSFVICDEFSEYLIAESVAVNNKTVLQITDSSNSETYYESIGNYFSRMIDLEPNEEVKLKIIAKISCNIEASESKTITITNKARIECASVELDETEEVKHIIVENTEQAEDVKNVISGYVWLDSDNNGQKDNSETGLSDITVKLYDNSIQNYLTDENGNVIKAVTDENGNYAFSKIKDGNYIIIFEYDNEKYVPTTKSIVNMKNLKIGEETVNVAGTEVINVQNNITNINIALKEKSSSTDDAQKPSDTETPGNTENTYSISGYAWIDANRDGDKDGEEITLSGVKVKLYNVSTGNYLTDNNGNVVETTTNNEGEYKFNNIQKGIYIVLFEYDNEKYEPTTYLAQGVDEQYNSNAILKAITVNGQELTLAVTDTINLQNNVSNINIGLKEKLIFDLELNKYISKIVVQNSKNTKTYEYDNETFGKVEIHRKQINGSLVVLEYTIKVKNNGEIAGYAKNIVDYLPSGLTFSSELNTDWYLSGNYLYTKGLENVEINPGEEKEIKLILTKTMTNENTGLINNRAEIYQDYNKYGEVDIDSTPNNQVQGEDDMGSVDIIIGPSTGGSDIANIILLLINLILIGFVINLMIKNEIIKIPSKKERG